MDRGGRGRGGPSRGGGGGGGGGGGPYRGGGRGGGGFDGRGDPRGGGGGGGRGFAPRGGGGGGFGGGPRGGGGFSRGSKSTVVFTNDILPKEVTKLDLDSAKFGWELQPLKPPPSKGEGTVVQRKINLIINHLASSITLSREGLYQYEIDIDLDDNSKLKKAERKAKNKDKDKGKPARSPQRRRGGDDEPGDPSKDPPRPVLWKKLVLKTVERIEQMEKEIYDRKNLPNPTKLATDGMKAIYTVHAIRCGGAAKTVSLTIGVKELGDDETGDDVYNVTVKCVAQIKTSAELQAYLNNAKNCIASGMVAPDEFVDADRIYNIALKTTALRTHTPVGRASFFPMPAGDGFFLGGGLVNWTGFSLTYTMGWKPFITVDVANSAFLLGQSVFEVLDDVFENHNQYRRGPGVDVTNVGSWRQNDFDKANDLLKSCKVSYVLANTGQKLTRRVSGISTGGTARDHTFDSDRGPTNVHKYFELEKKMKLKYPNGPVLELGKSHVPAEFCTVTKGQAWRHKLSEAQTASMIKDTAKRPADRLQTIKDSIRLSNFSQDPVLKEFGVSVAGQLTVLKDARILPPPTLVYGKSATQQARLTPGSDGVWDMFAENCQFVRPFLAGKPVKWAVLNLADTRSCHDNAVFNFVKEMARVAQGGGLNLGDANTVMKLYTELNLRPPMSKGLKDYFTNIKQQSVDFVLVITPRKDTNTYAAIKKAAELETPGGILTQCIVANNVQSAKPATVGNVVLKLNMKLGGVNNLLYIDQRMLTRIDVLKAPVIILGADVTHPGKDSKFPSLAAVTASTDRTGMPFMMHCQAQKVIGQGAAEIIENLDQIVKKMLAKFIEQTGHRPRKIIFYRDGVGDSQFTEVLQKEMLMIRDGCTLLARDRAVMAKAVKDLKLGDDMGLQYEPKITFIAVQKRHKTRFFPENPNDGVGKPQNAPPGTVVDTLIMNPDCTDFYLLSHIGIQGTSRPTRYQVLWDDTNFTVDEIQVLTYYLCYCYCRCNRSVSYPAPTYYAHLAATRAKIFTTASSDQELEDIPRLNHKIERQPDLLKMNPMHFV